MANVGILSITEYIETAKNCRISGRNEVRHLLAGFQWHVNNVCGRKATKAALELPESFMIKNLLSAIWADKSSIKLIQFTTRTRRPLFNGGQNNLIWIFLWCNLSSCAVAEQEKLRVSLQHDEFEPNLASWRRFWLKRKSKILLNFQILKFLNSPNSYNDAEMRDPGDRQV